MKCPKCNHTDIGIRHHHGSYACGWDDKARVDGEHLHYICRQCGYDWAGPTADAAK